MTTPTLVRPTAVTPARPASGGGAVVAAVPEELRTAARAGRDTEPALLEAAAVLRAAGSALAASGPETVGCASPLPALEPLADGLLAVVAVGRQLDAHLDRVAGALEAADAGALSGPLCPGPARSAGPLPAVATEVGLTGAQVAAEEAASRAARAGRAGALGALGRSVLDVAERLGRRLPRGVVAVARHTPLLSLALAPPLAAVETRRNGTPYLEALGAELAGALVGAALTVAVVSLAPVAVPVAAATAAGVVVGTAGGWLFTEATRHFLARRRRERAQRG